MAFWGHGPSPRREPFFFVLENNYYFANGALLKKYDLVSPLRLYYLQAKRNMTGIIYNMTGMNMTGIINMRAVMQFLGIYLKILGYEGPS